MATSKSSLVGSCGGPVSTTLTASGSANGASKDQALQRARIQAETLLDAYLAGASAGATCPSDCPTQNIDVDPDYDGGVPQYVAVDGAPGVFQCTVQMSRVVTLTCAKAVVPPAISAIAPPGGPVAGGTQVTVSGIGFTGATSVSFGAAPASSFSVTNDAQLVAQSPPAAGAGPVDVSVTTAEGTSAMSPGDVFTYA